MNQQDIAEHVDKRLKALETEVLGLRNRQLSLEAMLLNHYRAIGMLLTWVPMNENHREVILDQFNDKTYLEQSNGKADHEGSQQVTG